MVLGSRQPGLATTRRSRQATLHIMLCVVGAPGPTMSHVFGSTCIPSLTDCKPSKMTPLPNTAACPSPVPPLLCCVTPVVTPRWLHGSRIPAAAAATGTSWRG